MYAVSLSNRCNPRVRPFAKTLSTVLKVPNVPIPQHLRRIMYVPPVHTQFIQMASHNGLKHQ
jgi:hypothetical protein